MPARSSSARNSRVHFPESLEGGSPESAQDSGFSGSARQQDLTVHLPRSRFLSATGTSSDWRFPGSPHELVTPPPTTYHVSGRSQEHYSNGEDADVSRRASDDSTNTLVDGVTSPSSATPKAKQTKFSSLSSYDHPYEIQSPRAPPSQHSPNVSHQDDDGKEGFDNDLQEAFASTLQLSRRRRGYLSNLIDLYNVAADEEDNTYETKRRDDIAAATQNACKLIEPLAYDPETEILDPDDPYVTGVRKKCLDDVDDIEKNVRRQLTYKERRKERQRIRIEFNICCESAQ